jgi:hypothetical protein
MRSMRRWIVSVSVLAVALGGCSGKSINLNPFATKRAPEGPELRAEKWAVMKRENAERIAGEGIPGKTTTQPSTKGLDGFVEMLNFTFWVLPNRAIDQWTGKTPGNFARMMEDDSSADARRTGILKLVSNHEFARTEPYTKRYWQIAQGDPDPLVRVAAIRALDRSRDPAVVPIAIKGLDSENVLIRVESAKALANIPDEKAVPAMLKHMAALIDVRGEGGRPEQQPESRDVRVACADGLRNFPTRDVVRALVEVLKDKQFEVSWQARKSLMLMTGHDFHYDQGKWTEYLTQHPL